MNRRKPKAGTIAHRIPDDALAGANEVGGWSETERLRELINLAPSFMAVLRGPEHVFEIANAACARIVGKDDLIGKPIREALPELGGKGLFSALDHVFASGEAVKGRRAELPLAASAESPQDKAWVDFVVQPLRDRAGRISGIFVSGSDVTEAALADRRRMESERLARATIDALPEHIAVIDDTGLILEVNKAWRDFAEANNALPGLVSEGVNYLEICDRAAALGVEDAADVATLIRDVAAGRRDIGTIEYPCSSPWEERWFAVNVSRFSGEGTAYLVVSHDNITERRRSDQKIEYLATHDTLTNLPNRNLLNVRAAQAIDHARRTGAGLALLFLDIDHFKQLNDVYGHAVGDAALDLVASELRSLVRVGDTVARLGGDEFVILLNDLRNPPEDAARLAGTLLKRLSGPIYLRASEASLTASIGISLYPDDGDDLVDLLKNADAAMYAAKNSGRNAFEFYTEAMSTKANERLSLESDLRRAMPQGQFELFYQPQVETATGRIIGIEALLRWKHPELGMIAPGRFIPVAEETGMIVPIGEWVLKTACEQTVLWQRDRGPLPIAVNVSPIQLRQPDFVDTVAHILTETGLDPALLELEVTESMVMSRTETMIRRLQDLKGLGISLAIDDFGTGYSNLGYLKSFPLDKLKIDQSFVVDLPTDPNAMSIVSAIVAMSHSLDLRVIAEGVESEEQAQYLGEIGCEQAQGYFYSVPLDALQMEEVLDTGQSLPKGRSARGDNGIG